MARPTGEIALALRSAALQGPATVRQLADRAQVGYATARYTASRLCDRGDLVVLDGNARPAVLVAAEAVDAREGLHAGLQQPGRGYDSPEPFGGACEALAMLQAGFWGTAPRSGAAVHTGVEDDDPGGI